LVAVRRRYWFLIGFALALTVRADGAASQPSPAPPKPSAPPATASKKPTEAATVERRLVGAAQRNPDSFDAHYQLASFYVQKGRLDAALPHLKRACTIDPTHYDSGHDLALALLETGNLNEARAQIERMIAAGDKAELHNLLGNVYERAENFVAAADEYQRAAHAAPTEEHLFDWGNNLLQLHAYEEAAQVFTAAVERHPKSARLHVGIGIAQYSRGQYEDAVKSFSRAADLAPADPRPYQFLGEMYGVAPAMGADVTRRLAAFARANPKNALAQFHYAMNLWKGQSPPPDEAGMQRVEALLRQAVALDRKLAKGFLELGILLSDQKRYKEAITELQRATQLEPDLAQAHYRLAQAYQRTGQKELADKELEIFERLKGGTR
jgi:tetratricopeptide (TPR) repeat protein